VSEAAAGTAPPKRLPPGRHGLSREQVRESQRRRLTAAATAALREEGYGAITLTEVARGAGVSTATFYQHFGDVWACLLAAFEAGGDRLCERIEEACGEARDPAAEPVQAGVAGALELLAGEPVLAYLLSTEPPSRAEALWAARRRLVARLAGMLRGVHGQRGDGGREARLIAGAIALVSIGAKGRDAGSIADLQPTLVAILRPTPPRPRS
jgi:AcrR family transcriptional regulator